MPRKSRRKQRRRTWLREVAGLMLWALAILLIMSLWSYHPRDLSWFGGNERLAQSQNLAGLLGATLAEFLHQAIGRVAWVLPALLLVAGWGQIRPPRGEAAHRTTFLGGSFLLLGSCALWALVQPRFQIAGDWLPGGGWIGDRLASFLVQHLNRPGAIILTLTVILVSFTLAAQLSILRLLALTRRLIEASGRSLLVLWSRTREARRKQRLREAVLRKHAARRQTPPEPIPIEEEEDFEAHRPGPAGRPAVKPPHIRREAEVVPKRSPAKPGSYTLPPLTLLSPPPGESPVDEKELMAKARLLTEKFREFDVGGTVVQIHPGPVVTTFEFKPEAGIKFSKMLGLADDLALGLKAESVRIARISGHSTVGIEVPNRIREMIHLREILASEAFARSTAKLTIGLGKRIDGEVYVTDLARMPHLLIAGATGTGKSVALNAIITSILFRATPDEVKFTMIDTKRLELGMYEDIPHLLTPVVVEPKHAANALRWATSEMERRYRQLAEIGVRSIDQYNGLLRSREGRRRDDEDAPKPLPYLVVVIDELADLMLSSAREVEESITRLAQMARAVGIHLILSTQRPSVDIITGIIKANFPARIAFHVSSRVDSRTIIDSNGAERLLGLGDMLFVPPGTSRQLRLHGPLITEEESHRLVDYLKRQARPVYDMNIIRDAEEEPGSGAARALERDALYEEAARMVIHAGQASVSHLQRRLRLGYARAARVMDQLEANGIVGPADGSKMRQVLVDTDFLESLAERGERL
ncbi:MAG: DNA translocase FtsK 4TM domain-containing protein [Acidobacteriota bacterium]